MKKIVISALLCLVLCASLAFAGEDVAKSGDDSKWMFKPTLSLGYAFSSDTHIKFDTRNIALLGATNIELKIPSFSGVYLAGELPFALTDRFKVTLGGSRSFTGSTKDTDQRYNNSFIIGRFWDSDDCYWVTADLLLSYAFIKNVSFLKDLSALVGFRYDNHTMHFENPHIPVGVVSLPTDTLSFRRYTYSPVFGLTSIFKGFKYDIFGGDVKLGIFGSPIGWGKAKYRESFGGATGIRIDGDIDHVSFFKILGEFTLLSGKITPGIEASLSFFVQYTKFYTHERLSGVAYAGAGPVGQSPFNYKMEPDLTALGVKASIAF
jgi:hypothetical protein